MGDRVPVLLLGNKLDNEKEREVPQGLGEQLAKVKSKRRSVTPREVGQVPRSLGGDFLWKCHGKGATVKDGCLGVMGMTQLLCM